MRVFIFLIITVLWVTPLALAEVFISSDGTGTYVGGLPNLSPHGAYVDGAPNIALDGSYVDGAPKPEFKDKKAKLRPQFNQWLNSEAWKVLN